MTTATEREHGDAVGLLAGSGVLLVQAFALIPGLLPCLLLAGVFALPLILPVLALALVGGVVIGVPVGVWRLIRRVQFLPRLSVPAAREDHAYR